MTVSNMTGTLKQEMVKVIYNFALNGKLKENQNYYEKEIVKGAVDICSLSDGVFGNLVERFVYEQIKDHSNIKLHCPIVPGFYYGYNLPTISDNNLPRFFIGNGGKFEYSVRIRGKPSSQKPFILLCSFKLYFEIYSKI